MLKSLFEWTSFKFGCNAQYDKSEAWASIKCQHYFSIWKKYETQSFLYFEECTKASNKCLKSHDSIQQSKHIIYLKERNIFYGYVMLKFLPRNGIKRVDTKDFDLKKYISNKSKYCVLEVDIWIEIPKELPKLVPEKIELKKDMLPKYQLIMLPDFYNILKYLVPNFLIKKSMYFIMRTCNFTWDKN